VSFTGGQGLLLITDLDTVVIDATIMATIWLFVVSARRNGISPPAVFVLVLTVLLGTTLAYVVTNYGTLFRLRLLATTALWMLPVMIPSGAHSAYQSRLT
jgi:hypothetical protein